MPVIIVQGRSVPVSDDFLKLSPNEQSDAVRYIADQIAQEPDPGQPPANTPAGGQDEPSTGEYAEDAAKSFGVGVAKGGIGLAGMGGDVREGISGASNWLAEKLGASPENAKWFGGMVREGLAHNPALPVLNGPTSSELTDLVRRATVPAPTLTQLVTGERPQSFIDRKSRSTLGEYSQTLGEFAPAALTGPGGLLRRAAVAVVPAVLSETAGQVARATGNEKYEPWVRFGAGLLGGGLAYGDKLLRFAKPSGPSLNPERFAAGEPGQIAESNRGLGVNERPATIGKGENAQASKTVQIYNPIPKPQRSFKNDYAGKPLTDEAGKLLKDREGRSLIAKWIFGRQKIDGPDVPATPSDVRSIADETLRDGIEIVAPSEIGGNAGRASFDRRSGAPLSIQISNKLTQPQTEKVLAHEVAHVIQNFFGGVSIEGIKRELNFIYNALTTGRERTRNLTLPKNIGYTVAETPVELLAEAIRAYMVDPNWIKTMAPKTAAQIREWVNTHPELSKIIQFNSIGAGIAGAAFGAGGQSDAANAAEAPSQQSPQRSFLEGAGSIPSVPPGLAGDTTKAGADGLNKIAEALSQRGLYPQALKNEKFRGLVQALANLRAKQDSLPYGGPR